MSPTSEGYSSILLAVYIVDKPPRQPASGGRLFLGSDLLAMRPQCAASTAEGAAGEEGRSGSGTAETDRRPEEVSKKRRRSSTCDVSNVAKDVFILWLCVGSAARARLWPSARGFVVPRPVSVSNLSCGDPQCAACSQAKGV